MTCDECQEREAEITVTQIVDDEMETVHLCAACAAERGVEVEGSGPETAGSGSGAPLADFLAQTGKGSGGGMVPARSEACAYCGTTLADFRRTGQLGCPQCWPHFDEQLRALLRRIHGATQHVGKLYVGSDPQSEDAVTRLSALRHRLERAVETEDFETAAELRDRIREMEAVE